VPAATLALHSPFAAEIFRRCCSFSLLRTVLVALFAGEEKPSGWDFLRDEAAAEEEEESEEESAYSESEDEADEEEDEDLSDDDVVSEEDSEEDYGAWRERRAGRRLVCVLTCRVSPEVTTTVLGRGCVCLELSAAA
jgi:hypothetical protein